jgi:hypothetical protein
MNSMTITFDNTILEDFNNGVFDGKAVIFDCIITDASGDIYPAELQMQFGWDEDEFIEAVNEVCDICDDLPVNFHVKAINSDFAFLN